MLRYKNFDARRVETFYSKAKQIGYKSVCHYKVHTINKQQTYKKKGKYTYLV